MTLLELAANCGVLGWIQLGRSGCRKCTSMHIDCIGDDLGDIQKPPIPRVSAAQERNVNVMANYSRLPYAACREGSDRVARVR